MCAVVYLLGGALDATVFGAAAALRLDILLRAPQSAIFIIAFVMAIWMVVRRRSLRHTAEMSGATLLGAIRGMTLVRRPR